MIGVNVESKTRCTDLGEVAELAAAAGARYEGRLHQVDTYFAVEQGRLKLREIVHTSRAGDTSATAELIRYERPDEAGARKSAYERTELADPTAKRAQLAAEHDIRGVVEKDRELWLVDATRIHLDRVIELGDFVELETVCVGAPTTAERAEHDRIFRLLALDPADSVEGSYADLAFATPEAPAQASERTRR